MNITTERWSRTICFLLGMGIIVGDYDAYFRSYLVRKPDYEAGAGLGSKNELRDPREAGMETGIRAERADEGASVGLGSKNNLRDPRRQNIGSV